MFGDPILIPGRDAAGGREGGRPPDPMDEHLSRLAALVRSYSVCADLCLRDGVAQRRLSVCVC